MSNTYRIKINLTSREFEVEGSEDFVKELIDKYKDYIGSEITNSGSAEVDSRTNTMNLSEIPEIFGEYYNVFPTRDISDTDRFLIAANFIQSHSEDNDYSTNEVSTLLSENGVKLSNPSQSNKNNLEKGFAYKTSGSNYRVGNKGGDYLIELSQ